MVVDIDNLGTEMSREENQDTKKVYTYLFHVLRNCILTFNTPIVQSSLGQPPFEKPSIEHAISNLLTYKFSHLAQQEWKAVSEVKRILLHCLNTWALPNPSNQKHIVSPEEATIYKMEHMRWLVFCNAPTFCDSFQHYDTTAVFGRTLLRAIFKYMRKQIMDQFNRERDKMPQERRVMMLTHFPLFFNQLEEEIYAQDSPIWDVDFKPGPGFQNMLDSGKNKCMFDVFGGYSTRASPSFISLSLFIYNVLFL